MNTKLTIFAILFAVIGASLLITGPSDIEAEQAMEDWKSDISSMQADACLTSKAKASRKCSGELYEHE